MAGLLINGDGSLKTGRVSFLAFGVLLVCAGLLFKISAPMDRALVAVNHVFEAQEMPSVEQKPVTEQEAEMNGPVEQTRIKKAVTPPPMKSENTKPNDSARPATQKPQNKEVAEKDQPNKTADHVIPMQKEPLKNDAAQPEQRPPGEKKAGFDTAGLARLAADGDKREPARSEQTDMDVSETLGHVSKWSETPKKKDWSAISAGMNKLIRSGEENKKAGSYSKAGIPGGKMGSTLPSNKIPAADSIPSADPKPIDIDPSNRAITVDAQDYMALFHGWRNSGETEHGEAKIPLRVENLRSAYDLFQMRPIAVVRDKIFIDLTDATRVPEKALDDYSATVFLVDGPWAKWGEALSAAGISRSDRIEVRYYMYTFIRNAIFTRANQAFSWLKGQGLIGQDVTSEEVDVLGRTYVIKRQGGGRFGVFVPVSVDTRDGRSVAVDPACFTGQPDIEALKTAGLL